MKKLTYFVIVFILMFFSVSHADNNIISQIKSINEETDVLLDRVSKINLSLSKKVNVIGGSESDFEDAIIAIEQVYDFFQKYYGRNERFLVTIVFQDEVYYEFSENDKVRVYGYHPKGSDTVYVTKFDNPWIKERDSFGLPVSRELHRSIITHELVHLLLNKFADKIISGGPSEYIAFVAQIDSLSEETKEKVMKFTDKEFRSRLSINFITYMKCAHEFGIMCYNHFKETNGELLPEIMSGIFNPDEAINML